LGTCTIAYKDLHGHEVAKAGRFAVRNGEEDWQMTLVEEAGVSDHDVRRRGVSHRPGACH